jgi:hypothetical protein
MKAAKTETPTSHKDNKPRIAKDSKLRATKGANREMPTTKAKAVNNPLTAKANNVRDELQLQLHESSEKIYDIFAILPFRCKSLQYVIDSCHLAFR